MSVHLVSEYIEDLRNKNLFIPNIIIAENGIFDKKKHPGVWAAIFGYLPQNHGFCLVDRMGWGTELRFDTAREF